MNWRVKGVVAALGLAVAPMTTHAAWSTIGSGTLATGGDETLVSATPDWEPSTFVWTVEFDEDTGQFRYTYKWTFDGSDDPKSVSHFTVEASPSFTDGDIIEVSFVADDGEEGGLDKREVGPDSSSPNDDDGTPLYGIKWETEGEVFAFTASVTTLRAPIWGDIYIKDGGPVEITNAGYAAADPILAFWDGDGTCTGPSLCTGMSGWDWVAVPDTHTVVPEPASLVLMGLGALGLAGYARRRRRV